MALYDNFSSDGLDIEVHDGEEFQGRIISKDHYLLYATVGKNWASAQIPKNYYNNPDVINSAVLSIKNKITKLLATDTDSVDNFVNKGEDEIKMGSMLTKKEISSLKRKAEAYPRKYELINFNNRHMLLDLIEYTRNSSPGYGITNILDNFCKEKIRHLAGDTESFDKAVKDITDIFKSGHA